MSDGMQSLIDNYAFDLSKRGLAQSEIRERIGDFRIATTFTRGFRVEKQNRVASFAAQTVEVDD
jgi:hypothetical protein